MARVDSSRKSERFAYLAEGNARQARKRVAVDLLIRDTRNRALLVNPNYKEHWDLPGGMAETNESPLSAVRRELREELTLEVEIGRLLVLDWVGPHGPWDDQLIFIFDGGVLTQGEEQHIGISDEELSEFSFLGLQESRHHLRPDMWELLKKAYECLDAGHTQYLENLRP